MCFAARQKLPAGLCGWGRGRPDRPIGIGPPARAPAPTQGSAGLRQRGRGLGFGFLQTRWPEGNRGVSGNRTGNAEVRAAAGGGGRASFQCRGPVALWKFQEELGKTDPGKALPECTCPSPHPGGVPTEGVGRVGVRSLYTGRWSLRPPQIRLSSPSVSLIVLSRLVLLSS